ncbi:MAG: hypothetical protein Q7U34_08280 [Anaerolineales bacterium]|nr:hypothetical protein [Anaerolineales bacterium]
MNKYVALVLYLHEWLEFQQRFPEAGKYLHKKVATGATEVDNLVPSRCCAKELVAQTPEESGRHGWLFERKQRGQVAVLAALLIMLFVLLAAVLIDAYALLEARNWGYQAAQQAALSGISNGRDWASLLSPPCAGGPPPIQLVSATAQSATVSLLQQEMTLRGISNYAYDVRVLPDYGGGTVTGYPPLPTRLGAGRGNWTSSEPAVGVYLSFPVSTFLMSFVGRSTVQISVFAASGVDQPDGACTP